MSQRKADIATVLRAHGLSMTKQRRLVFETLEGVEPLSMPELYALVHGRVDRASLYRTIATFERLGVVSRINVGWKYKVELSDQFAEHHHHLTCLACGRVIPINEDELESFVEGVAAAHHFQPAEHQIEIQGYCAACRLY